MAEKTYISKLNIGGNLYYLKDAEAQALLATLKSAAFMEGTGEVDLNDQGLVTGAKVAEAIKDIAGAMHFRGVFEKLEDVTDPKAGDIAIVGNKEYVYGGEPAAWHELGDEGIYVLKTTKVAGIDLQNDITVAELQEALGLKALAYKDSASGTVAGQTISGVKATGDLSASLTGALGSESANASLTKGDYTPAGNVTGTVTAKGSIDVEIADASEATAAALTKIDYTPAGDVTGTVSVPNAAAIAKSDAGVAISGSVSKPSITVTPETQGVLGSVKTAGTVATFTEGAFSPATLGEASKSAFATEGMKVAIDSVDSECLVFSAAGTAQALTAQGEFFGGSKAADTFDGGAMPTFNDATVLKGASAALDAAPEFTGDKFAVNLTDTDRNISASFAGTKVENALVTGVNYYKQEIASAEFTGESANIDASFAGTEVKNMLVTGVSYDKTTIGTLGASAALPEGGLAVGDIVVSSKEVTVA